VAGGFAAHDEDSTHADQREEEAHGRERIRLV
jgi:hypothetical protein